MKSLHIPGTLSALSTLSFQYLAVRNPKSAESMDNSVVIGTKIKNSDECL
jgi:hypothetical protein